MEILVVFGESSGRSIWPPYMSQKLEDVVRDWVYRVEHGGPVAGNWSGTDKPITTEHLRIAKTFLDRNSNQFVD